MRIRIASADGAEEDDPEKKSEEEGVDRVAASIANGAKADSRRFSDWNKEDDEEETEEEPEEGTVEEKRERKESSEGRVQGKKDCDERELEELGEAEWPEAEDETGGAVSMDFNEER